jgi:hypothetical protein
MWCSCTHIQRSFPRGQAETFSPFRLLAKQNLLFLSEPMLLQMSSLARLSIASEHEMNMYSLQSLRLKPEVQRDRLYDASGAIFFVILIAVAGFAVITKPSRESFEDHVKNDIREYIENRKVESDNVLQGLENLGCKVYITECINLYRQMVRVEFEDVFFARIGRIYAKADSSKTESCLGVFNTWKCGLDI